MLRRLIAGVAAAALSTAAPVFAADLLPEGEAALDHISCRGGANEIRVTVSNVKKNVGLIVADLYPNREEGFLHSAGRVKQVRFAARSPVTSFCLYAPTPGQYAVSIYHDRNANRNFDKSAFGMPAEPYGVSNNPPMRFAAPAVTEAVFDVGAAAAAIKIALRG